MSSEEIEAEMENQQVWAEEAQRRDRELDMDPSAEIAGDQALRESRTKLN